VKFFFIKNEAWKDECDVGSVWGHMLDLWLNRNDFVFNNSLISSPRAIGFRLLSFLQHWGGRGADGGQECAAAGR
jgi:hypothetical protein